MNITLDNSLYFIVIGIVLFAILKIVIKIVDYFLFQKLLNALLDIVFEDQDEDRYDDEKKGKITPTNKEDFRLRGQEQERKEAKIEKEINKNKELALNQQRFKTRIVGVVEKKVFGPWTQMVINRFMKDLKNINIEDLANKGYFEAQYAMKNKSHEKERGRGI